MTMTNTKGVFVTAFFWLALFAIAAVSPAVTVAAAEADTTSLRGHNGPDNYDDTRSIVVDRRDLASNLVRHPEPVHKPPIKQKKPIVAMMPINNNNNNKKPNTINTGGVCACAAIYDPVFCGPYKEEFSNLCTARCEGSYTANQCKGRGGGGGSPEPVRKPPIKQKRPIVVVPINNNNNKPNNINTGGVCACAAIYDPVVCGPYKEEFSNLCTARCEGSYTANQCGTVVQPLLPPPPKKPTMCDCPYIFDPVLCLNKYEYDNYCVAGCDGYDDKDCRRRSGGGGGGGGGNNKKPIKFPIPPGGDLDQYGCRPSAGETWCPSLGDCIRPFEDGPCRPSSQQQPDHPKPPYYHPEPCACPQVYDPVYCSSSSYNNHNNKYDDDYNNFNDDYYYSDHVEYSNLCVAECEGGFHPDQCALTSAVHCSVDVPCPDEQFCNLDFDTEGFCEDCPPTNDFCHRIGLPQKGVATCQDVCGSGDHHNDDDYDHDDPEPCACPQVYDPVYCSSSSYNNHNNKHDDDYNNFNDDYYYSDNVEYSNLCVAECEGGFHPDQCALTSAVHCSVDVPCLDEQFCNLDFDTEGFCEDCPPTNDYCHRIGLPEKGVATCQAVCGSGDHHNDDDYDHDDGNDLCSLPIDAGPCYGIIPKWGYDSKSNRCKKFDYGGCEGNENNFKSKQACESLCLWYD